LFLSVLYHTRLLEPAFVDHAIVAELESAFSIMGPLVIFTACAAHCDETPNNKASTSADISGTILLRCFINLPPG
jgi:hypothetical protein